jgi:hypothetical protein
MSWIQSSVIGEVPCARGWHAAVAVSEEKMMLHGGCTNDSVSGKKAKRRKPPSSPAITVSEKAKKGLKNDPGSVTINDGVVVPRSRKKKDSLPDNNSNIGSPKSSKKEKRDKEYILNDTWILDNSTFS